MGEIALRPTAFRSAWRPALLAWLGLSAVFLVHLSLRVSGITGEEAQRFFIPLSFVLLWLTPFIFLSKNGRRVLGLFRFPGPSKILLSLAIGGALALAIGFLGDAMYGDSPLNWYQSVATDYRARPLPDFSPWEMFLVFTIPALLFSPFGEEFFFRGVMDQRLREKMGPMLAALIPAILFAGVHLFHHGSLLSGETSTPWITSTAIWFGCMMAVSIAFTMLRHLSETVWGAILAHMAFNAAMNYYIFYL